MSFQKFSFFHSAHIIAALGWSDFSLKYRGSLLGYVWSFIGPLGKFIVIYAVFGPFMKSDIPFYASYLFLGIIMWEHFVATTVGCINMPFEKESIIRRIVFPRVILIFSVGYTNLLIFGTHLIIFLLGSLFFQGLVFRFSSLYILVIALQMTMLALGVGMILGSYALKYRDIAHLWNIIIQILFWLCPVVYRSTGSMPVSAYIMALLRGETPRSLSEILRIIAELQPLSVLMRDARNTLLALPGSGIPTLVHILSGMGFTGAIFILGWWIFHRRSKYFLQEY